jgi:hypothetical protein
MRSLPLQRLPTRQSRSVDWVRESKHALALHLQVFVTSWRLYPRRACWPSFRPNPLLGLCPSELCSFRAAVHRLRCPCPHVVGYTGLKEPEFQSVHETEVPLPLRLKVQCAYAPRLQGFAPHESPPLRRSCLDCNPARSSHGLLPSRALSLTALEQPSLPHPLMRFQAGDKDRSLDNLQSPLQGLANGKIGWSPKRLPTLLGFVTF